VGVALETHQQHLCFYERPSSTAVGRNKEVRGLEFRVTMRFVLLHRTPKKIQGLATSAVLMIVVYVTHT